MSGARLYRAMKARDNLCDIKCGQEAEKRKAAAAQNQVIAPPYGALQDEERFSLWLETHIFSVWGNLRIQKQIRKNMELGKAPENIFPSLTQFDIFYSEMKRIGADTKPIDNFIKNVEAGRTSEEFWSLFEGVDIDTALARYMAYIIDNSAVTTHTHVLLALMLCEPEELIPSVIEEQNSKLFNDLKTVPDRQLMNKSDVEQFLCHKCGEDAVKWSKVKTVATKARKLRTAVWESMLETWRQAGHWQDHNDIWYKGGASKEMEVEKPDRTDVWRYVDEPYYTFSDPEDGIESDTAQEESNLQWTSPGAVSTPEIRAPRVVWDLTDSPVQQPDTPTDPPVIWQNTETWPQVHRIEPERTGPRQQQLRDGVEEETQTRHALVIRRTFIHCTHILNTRLTKTLK